MGHIVNVLVRFGCVLDAYLEQFPVEDNGWPDWRQELFLERKERVHNFREWMEDMEWFRAQLGDERQQLELVTLMKYDLTKHYAVLTDYEISLIDDVYTLVARQNGMVVNELPVWFLSPCEVLKSRCNRYLHGVRVTEVFSNTGCTEEHWEEACLRQAALWTSLSHPHVAVLLGACHVGAKPYFVHEPTERNRANAHLWEPLLGCGLALQYLHEQGLGFSNLVQETLLVRSTSTSQGVLCGLGLVRLPDKQRDSIVDDMIRVALLFCGIKECTEDKEGNIQRTGVTADTFNFGMAILSSRQSCILGPLRLNQPQRLPSTCPYFLREMASWTLLQGMCTPDFSCQVNMNYVIQQLKYLVDNAAIHDDVCGNKLEKISDVDSCMIPTHQRNVESIMRQIRELSKEIPIDVAAGKALVFQRLVAIYRILRSLESVDRAIVCSFGDVLGQFLMFLELNRRIHNNDYTQTGKNKKRLKPCATTAAIFCAARTEHQRLESFHHDIDKFHQEHLLSLNGQVQQTWKRDSDEAREQHIRRFQDFLKGSFTQTSVRLIKKRWPYYCN